MCHDKLLLYKFIVLTMSMIFEHYGWLGSKKSRINKEKIFAID